MTTETIDQPAATPMLIGGEAARYYPPSLFTPSPTQPRKTFVAAVISELGDSIAKSGQIHPILARPNPAYVEGNGQPPYEIVCGESRWRAVTLRELPLLAIIRPLTDFEVLELQIIENMARSDLHPIEEAEGLKRLLRDTDGAHGYLSADELADRLGKSRRWVYGRLQLLNLCSEARDAFVDGTINASVAGLIARMPDKGQQAEATKRILEGWGGEPFSFRAAADYVQKHFMLNLGKARFDIQAAYPIAGPCSTCVKRSGANPDLFAEITSGDLCQDSGCYQAKTQQHRDAELQAARDAGHQVLQGDEARRLMPNYAVAPTGYVRFDEPCPQLTDSKKPLCEIIGSKARNLITVEHPVSDELVVLLDGDQARKLLKAKNLLREPSASARPQVTTAGAANGLSDARNERPERVIALTEKQLALQTDARASELFSVRLMQRLHQQLLTAPEWPAGLFRLAAFSILDSLYFEAVELLYKAHGWERPEVAGRTLSVDLHERLETLSIQELGMLIIESTVLEELSDQGICLDGIKDSNYVNQPTLTVFQELGIVDELETIQAQANEDAHQQIHEAESRRITDARDATQAFIDAHGSDPAQPAAGSKGRPVKYRNADTGETWSGRGLQPKWLKVAIENGAKLEDFEVDCTVATPASPEESVS